MTDLYWKVAVDYYVSRYVAYTHTGSGTMAQEVVPTPVPLAEVSVNGFDVMAEATAEDHEEWQRSRLRGDAVATPSDEQPGEDEAFEEFGEWGGVLWVARGRMTVVVQAADPDQLEYDEVSGFLPTVLNPEDFEGDAEPADWV